MITNGNHGGFVKIGAVALSGLIVLSALPLQSQAAEQAKPGPEHKKLEMWAGEWKYEGTGDVTPWYTTSGKFRGLGNYRIVLGGFFLTGESQDINDEGYLWQSIWFIEYDEKEKSYVFHSFENDGTRTRGKCEVAGNTWTVSSPRSDSKGKVYPWRMITTFSPDGRKATEVAEYSADDGKTWARDYQVAFTKVSP